MTNVFPICARWLLALVLPLALAGCEEESSMCTALCADSLDVDMHRRAWPDGEYTLVAHYDFEGEPQVNTCTFTLPSGEDARCEESEPDGFGDALVVNDEVVTLYVASAPSQIALELELPDGALQSFELEPTYEPNELCAQNCRVGSISHSLDGSEPP